MKKPEENWVWNATGRIDMHMPDRWGYLLFSGNKVGTIETEMDYPHNRDIYKIMWAIFYAQQDYMNQNRKYASLEEIGLTAADLKPITSQKGRITMETTSRTYEIRVWVPNEEVTYVLNNQGNFKKEKK